jgi:hypothetical protein
MTVCPSCRVNTVDRRCEHEDHVCYDCCTTRPAVSTCRYHFGILGLLAQTARSAAGLGPPAPLQPSLPEPIPAAQLDVGDVGAPLGNAPPSPPVTDPSAVIPPAPTELSALAAIIAAALQQQQVALTTLQAQMAAMQAIVQPLPSPPLLPPSPPHPPLIPPPAAPLASNPIPSSPPPHRAAVLGGGALAESTNSLLRLLSAPVSIPADSREVRPQDISHIPPSLTHVASSPPARFNPLPTALIPAEVGSVQDNTQLLTKLITTFHKSTVKYSSLKDLDQSLEDWWVKASKSGTWTGPQLMSVANYRAFIGVTLGPNFPFSKILEYHRLFTVAVNDGEHDMFEPGGHFVAHLYLKAGFLESHKSSSSHFSRKGGKASDRSTETGTATGAAGSTGSRPRHPDSGKHPAGSCSKHPTSTTHTTAECRST